MTGPRGPEIILGFCLHREIERFNFHNQLGKSSITFRFRKGIRMRWSALVGAGILGMAFLVGSSEGGGKDAKDGKIKGFLPSGWKDLGLTAAQKEKVYEMQAKYKAKYEDLKEQEKKFKQEEKAELSKILTDEQRETLKKLVLGEDTKKPK